MAEERRGGRPGQGSGRPRSGGQSGAGKPRSAGAGSKSGSGQGGAGKGGTGKSYGSSERGRGTTARTGGRDGARGDSARTGGRDGGRDTGRGSRDGARSSRDGGGDFRRSDREGTRTAGPKGAAKGPGKGSGKGPAKAAGGKGPAKGGKGASYTKSGSDRGSAWSGERRSTEREPRTADQVAYDGPDLPEEITGKEIDRSVANQLKGLPEKLAARIARHLAAAGMYIDDDPELAYQHAKAAKARAQRLAVIREALGEAAYAAGHYAEALAELRAAKRMNGATAYLPIMADCHRALGHPEQAIKLAHSPSVVNFKPEAKAEMTLVEAGARRDQGQLDAALRVLELSPLSNKSRASWVVRLRYAYADTLEAAGRLNEALSWFHRTHAIDAEDLTDAAARAADLEARVGDDA
jgi:hypothetical protein